MPFGSPVALGLDWRGLDGRVEDLANVFVFLFLALVVGVVGFAFSGPRWTSTRCARCRRMIAGQSVEVGDLKYHPRCVPRR